MPQCLNRIYPAFSANCWRGSSTPVGYAHIFWDCPRIQYYWQEMTQFLHRLTTIPIPLMVSISRLALVDSLAFAKATLTLLGILQFFARKTIVLKWTSARPPTLSSWKQLVNAAIPLYKATYLSRRCPKKYEKVWHLWTDSESMAND